MAMAKLPLAALLFSGAAGLPLMDLERECASTEDGPLFQCWLAKYGKELGLPAGTPEAERRFPAFQRNLALIRAHNADPARSWTMDAGEFAGHAWEEFKAERLGAPQDCSATHGRTARAAPGAAAALPASVDWRTKGVVTPVKTQGACGSCWTFSTTGVVESHLALSGGNLTTLSEQQLVDCAGAFNNHGCNGGLPSQAMEYIRYVGGLEGEKAYPYKAKDGRCQFDASQAVAHVADVVNISQGDEQAILEAVGTVGPVAIAYDCVAGFHLYRSGVWDGPSCGTKPSQVNHAVLAVGYGHDSASGKDYWLVKNSWGVSFGENGYFRIVRGKNKCGLAECASYPKMQKQPDKLLLVV